MLRLNYYNGNQNFGDALAKSLIERLLGQMVVHATCYESQLMSVGSVFGDGSRFIAKEGQAEADASNQPLIVWGSGFLEPKIPDGKLIIRRRCDIRAVRGIHTREALVKCGLMEKGSAVALGDPGILYPDLVPGCRETEKLYDVALVPHVLDRDRAVEIKKAFEGVGLKVVQVDVMQANPLNCIREIAASKKVIASSMHALIVADSLGIPNRRLKFTEFFRENDKRQYDQSDFKFKDYYSAFGMKPPKCTTEEELLKDPLAAVADISDKDVVPVEKVDSCKRGLLAAFPESLKNEQRVTSAAKSPKLSVIIPVFNAEFYLHECLASVLTQDAFGDFEVICVDDGSTDSSPDILSYWADRDARLKVLTQDNQGPGVARNAGLFEAKGEYITFLDADDRLTSGDNLKAAFDHAVVNRLDVEALASNNGPDGDGKWSDNRHLRRELVPQKKVFTPKDVGIYLFQFVLQEPWAKLYRREFIAARKLVFPALKRSEDFPFVMSALLLSKKIGVLDVPLCDHRVGVATSLESTKDETPCIFVDAAKWFCKSINLPRRAEWAKLAFRISQVIRYAYNLGAVQKYSSFRNITSCLCDNSENLFRRVESCQLASYTNAYEFLCLIKRSDDDFRMELMVDNRVKRQVGSVKKNLEMGREEDRLKLAKLRSVIGELRELNERLGLERQASQAKIEELSGTVVGLREERNRLAVERTSDKSEIAKRDERIAALQVQLEECQKAVSKRDEWLASEKGKVAKRDERIAALQVELEEHQKAVSERDEWLSSEKGKVAKCDERIAALQVQLEERQKAVSERDEWLSAEKAKVAKRDERIAELKSQLEASWAKTRQMAEWLSQSKSAGAKRDERIAELKSQLEASWAKTRQMAKWLSQSNSYAESLKKKLETVKTITGEMSYEKV